MLWPDSGYVCNARVPVVNVLSDNILDHICSLQHPLCHRFNRWCHFRDWWLPKRRGGSARCGDGHSIRQKNKSEAGSRDFGADILSRARPYRRRSAHPIKTARTRPALGWSAFDRSACTCSAATLGQAACAPSAPTVPSIKTRCKAGERGASSTASSTKRFLAIMQVFKCLTDTPVVTRHRYE